MTEFRKLFIWMRRKDIRNIHPITKAYSIEMVPCIIACESLAQWYMMEQVVTTSTSARCLCIFNQAANLGCSSIFVQ